MTEFAAYPTEARTRASRAAAIAPSITEGLQALVAAWDGLYTISIDLDGLAHISEARSGVRVRRATPETLLHEHGLGHLIPQPKGKPFDVAAFIPAASPRRDPKWWPL